MSPWKEKRVIGNATLYLGDCLSILPHLPKVDAVITDPPYGIREITGDCVVGRTKPKWTAWDSNREWDESTSKALPQMIACGVDAIVWGGHLYDLPQRRGWLVWDKMQDAFSSGQCELAWTTLEQPIRRFKYSHGQLFHEGKEHPTQKPLPLMTWCLDFLPNAASVADPYMGGGTTGVACMNLGRQFIGIEIEPKYFEIACERIENAQRQQRMFA